MLANRVTFAVLLLLLVHCALLFLQWLVLPPMLLLLRNKYFAQNVKKKTYKTHSNAEFEYFFVRDDKAAKDMC